MKPKVYIFHADPGHAWLAVRRQELADLGIADKITTYSYTKGTTAYLEEDLDASTFFNAYREKHGVNPEYRTSNREQSHPIRRFARYTV